jgi:MFS family permease
VVLFAFTPVDMWYSKSLLIIARGFIGFTQAFLCVYVPLWVHEYAPKSRRAGWMSYLQGAVPIGVTLGYLMASVTVWVNESFRGCGGILCWRWPFILQVILVTPLALGLFWIPDEHILMRFTRRPSITSTMSAEEAMIDDEVFDNDRTSNWQNIRTLFKIPVFVSLVMGLSALFFCVTGVQYWATLFLTTNTKNSAYTTHLAYLIVSGTGPIMGVIFGGKLIDQFGGYAGPLNEVRTLKICMVLGFLGVGTSIPISYMSNTYLIAVFLWLMLFSGGAVLPPCSGIVIACAPQHLRPLASSVASTCYNFLGFAASNYLPGLVMDFMLTQPQFKSMGWTCDEACTYRIGFRIVTWWTVFAFICLTAAWIASTRKARLHLELHLENGGSISPYY